MRREVVVTFIPEQSAGIEREVGFIEPGEEKQFQFFDPRATELKDAKGFPVRPAGSELIVEHRRLHEKAFVYQAPLADPGQEQKREELFVLSAATPRFEKRVMTAASEVGHYVLTFVMH